MVLAISICLSPVSLIGALILAAALIFGWVAIGLEVGRRLALAFRREWHPATQAGLGTLLLSFVIYAVGLIPCLGFIVGAGVEAGAGRGDPDPLRWTGIAGLSAPCAN